MTREECPKEYFEHLTEVVRSVFAAENKLRASGVLSKEAVKGKSAQWYCEKVAEELISRTEASELTINN